MWNSRYGSLRLLQNRTDNTDKKCTVASEGNDVHGCGGGEGWEWGWGGGGVGVGVSEQKEGGRPNLLPAAY